jgi:hypothetical protein
VYGVSVLEKTAPRGIFETLRNELVGSWRNLYNEELLNLCCSANIRIAMSRRMGWAGNVL